jgi:hypothetical protein
MTLGPASAVVISVVLLMVCPQGWPSRSLMTNGRDLYGRDLYGAITLGAQPRHCDPHVGADRCELRVRRAPSSTTRPFSLPYCDDGMSRWRATTNGMVGRWM